MSKWVDAKKFEDFREERQEDNTGPGDNITFARKYPNPKMGDQNRPNEYHLRLVPDPEGSFYKKIMYHMFQSGESWNFIMCPKTFGMNEYCPWCAITQLLYKGSSADKKKASQYKRKEKYVGNVFVQRDPRDANETDEERKLEGKTFLYEFPSVVEGQIRKEVTDTENGWGYVIFDPEEGHDLILRISAKKPDANGKVWPDYSQTTFAKRPSSIADSEEEVKEIMDTTQSITEYINNSMWEPDKHEELLKSEMLWDDVEADFLRHMKRVEKKQEEKVSEDTPDPDREAHKEKKGKEKEKGADKKDEDTDPDDQDLLDELADL